MIIAKQGIKLFSTATNNVNLSKNYYKILQVDKACDQKLIKNSYLQLVKALHPDVNPNGKDKFTEVQQAYEVLSDNDLKKYYDQNNYCNNPNSNPNQTKAQPNASYSAKSGPGESGYTRTSSSGHQYYTHRNYYSENPRDYYTDNEPKPQQNTNAKNEQHDSDDQPYRKAYNSQQSQHSHNAWQSYQQQKQQWQQQTYQHETDQQRQLRDKLKAMRGCTSSYNVMWARHHLKPQHLAGQNTAQKQRDQDIKKIIPEKVRIFYDKIIDKLERIATKGG